jgi:hypothetical protein
VTVASRIWIGIRVPIRGALICTTLTILIHANCRGQAKDEGSDEATVHITSAPTGAEIYVDGKFVGSTPSQIKLKSGEHSVKIAIAGHAWSRLLQVTSGELTVHADLSAQLDNGGRKSTPESHDDLGTVNLRALAQTIKQCPEETMNSSKWGKGPTEIVEIRRGPPQNVVWNVLPNDSVRAPSTGYIQFAIRTTLWVPPESFQKYTRKYPGLWESFLKHDRPTEYRYEFDLAPSELELLKMLSRDEGDAEWKTANLSGSCWGQAVQKTQTAPSTK